MYKMEIPKKILRIIQACVQGSKCKVKYEEEETKKINIEIELKQDDTISPVFFNIVLESVMRKTLDGATRIKRNDQ